MEYNDWQLPKKNEVEQMAKAYVSTLKSKGFIFVALDEFDKAKVELWGDIYKYIIIIEYILNYIIKNTSAQLKENIEKCHLSNSTTKKRLTPLLREAEFDMPDLTNYCESVKQLLLAESNLLEKLLEVKNYETTKEIQNIVANEITTGISQLRNISNIMAVCSYSTPL